MSDYDMTTTIGVIFWARTLDFEHPSGETVPAPSTPSDFIPMHSADRKACARIAENERLRLVFDGLVNPDELFEHCDGVNHERDIQALRNAINPPQGMKEEK